MVTYFLTIDYVLSSDPKVFARVIPTMERVQWLFGTLDTESDCQPLPALIGHYLTYQRSTSKHCFQMQQHQNRVNNECYRRKKTVNQ
jgi:hypothetical protein